MRYLLILFLFLPCVVLGLDTGNLGADSANTPAGDFVNPDSVLTDNAQKGYFNAVNETLYAYHYTANLADSAVIDSIRVVYDAWRAVNKEDFTIQVWISKDNGANWSSGSEADAISELTETRLWVRDADWGYGSWSYSECDSLAVRVRCTHFGGSQTHGYIEYLAMQIFYHWAVSTDTSQKGLNVDDKLGAGKGLVD